MADQNPDGTPIAPPNFGDPFEEPVVRPGRRIADVPEDSPFDVTDLAPPAPAPIVPAPFDLDDIPAPTSAPEPVPYEPPTTPPPLEPEPVGWDSPRVAVTPDMPVADSPAPGRRAARPAPTSPHLADQHVDDGFSQPDFDVDLDAFAENLVQSVADPEAEAPTSGRRRHAGPEDGWDDGLRDGEATFDGTGVVDGYAQAPDNPVAPQPGRPAIEAYLTLLVNKDGSDLHINADEAPRMRIHGHLRPIPDAPIPTQEDVRALMQEIATEKQWKAFTESNELDTAYAMDEREGAALTSRFRCNFYVSMDKLGMVLRVIPTTIKSLDDLGILPQVKGLSTLPRGMVLVTGPTGSGKSTTLAALVDLMNETREERIFTFEDPIEFTHKSKKAMISHREIGTDTDSFYNGLKAVRREDPDIILIGEMRDNETIRAAIEAADTGHYVMATLHTSSASETVGRIVNTFPAEEQNQIRITLAANLRAVICQTLVPSAKSSMGRVVASEIMIVTPAIRNLIRENKLPEIQTALSDTSQGSISLDAHLAKLIQEGLITKKEALKKATSPAALDRQLGGTGSSRLI